MLREKEIAMPRKTLRCVLAGLCLTGLSGAAAESRPLARKLAIEERGGLDLSGGLLRLPRNYRQGGRGEVIIEAEEPTRFVGQDAGDALKTVNGREDRAGGGRYAAFLSRGEYDIRVDRPMRLRLWRRTFFPFPGNWTHGEALARRGETGKPQGRTDMTGQEGNRDVGRWLWQQGDVYDFTAGVSTFTLDWQGGARLDQLAFLPEGVEPKRDGEWFAATFAEGVQSGVAVCEPVTLHANQEFRRLDMVSVPAGGEVVDRKSVV